MTQILMTPQEISTWRQRQTQASPLVFIPTMGALHEGHLSLIHQAQSLGGHVVVSVFVNPTQFSAQEDFHVYPRNIQQDVALLTSVDVDAVFLPSFDTVYPHGLPQATQITVPELSTVWCGHSRPGHFDGVASVLVRLFHLVQPTHAVFGEKDFQQLVLVRRLVSDLSYPITILSVPTKREPSGLASSSRNAYLSPADRQRASVIYLALTEAARLFVAHTPFQDIITMVREKIESEGLQIDYVGLVDDHYLQDLLPTAPIGRLLVAATLGNTRLIDNIALSRQLHTRPTESVSPQPAATTT